METKHTPGPWQVVWYPSQRTAEIETVEQEPGKYRHMTNNLPMCAGINVNDIEHIVDADDPEKRDYSYSAEACANARLMAAAPELLEACKSLFGYIEKGFLVRDISKDASPTWALSMAQFVADLQKVQMAITKAEGK